MNLTKRELEIKERLEKVTPGEWRTKPENPNFEWADEDKSFYFLSSYTVNASETTICAFDYDSYPVNNDAPIEQVQADASLVANAPTDIAYLLETVSKLREALKLALYYVEGDATYEGVVQRIREMGIEETK